MFKGIIAGEVKKIVPKAIQSLEDTLNKNLKDHNYKFFEITPIPGFPMNLSMTAAPSATHGDDMLKLHMNLLTIDDKAGTTHVNAPTAFPVYFPNSHKDQIFLHQSFFESFYFALKSKVNVKTEAESLRQVLKMFIPEFEATYGANYTFEIGLSLSDNPQIKFSNMGINVTALGADVVVYAGKAGTKPTEDALNISLRTDLHMNGGW
jgi:hypothetical protein